ncbi:MAG TPA: helix-turn-helix domain-containing protein [Ruminiclostridium sp.]|nr:helix-turn-helix domain-containing protein [Ruminiclostridium sp.]
MEKERAGVVETNPHGFIETVRKAQQGDKESMDKILDFFTTDIEYLSKYIMLPREDAIQMLKIELISIIYYQL